MTRPPSRPTLVEEEATIARSIVLLVVAIAAVGTALMMYLSSESGVLRRALDTERHRIDQHSDRLNEHGADLSQHSSRLDVVESGLQHEAEVNRAQEREISETRTLIETSAARLALVETAIESHAGELAELERWREIANELQTQHRELEERLAELISNSNRDHRDIQALREELEALRDERAADGRRIQRIERILGLDPDI